jgi:hypothetical protein
MPLTDAAARNAKPGQNPPDVFFRARARGSRRPAADGRRRCPRCHASHGEDYLDKLKSTTANCCLRPVQIWVPDTRRPGFAAECRRQCLALRKDRAERNTLKWLSKVADTEGWK